MNKYYIIPIILMILILIVSTFFQYFNSNQKCLFVNNSSLSKKLFVISFSSFNAYTETLSGSTTYAFNLGITLGIILLFLAATYLLKEPQANTLILFMYLSQLIIFLFTFSTRCFEGGTSLFSVDSLLSILFLPIILFLIVNLGIRPLKERNRNRGFTPEVIIEDLKRVITKNKIRALFYIVLCISAAYLLVFYSYNGHKSGALEYEIMIIVVTIVIIVLNELEGFKKRYSKSVIKKLSFSTPD